MKRNVGALALMLTLAVCAGCGYRVLGEGTHPRSALWIGPVDDESREPLFGAQLRTALAREAVNRADFSLASRDRASGLLIVRVLSAGETAVAFVAGDEPRQYRLDAQVEAALSRADGTVVWKALRLKGSRLFAAGDTVEGTQQNKDQALAALAGELSREVLRRAALALDPEFRP